ncbi:MAG: thioredoxin domain-containing protein [Anaerolineales bacterium]
MATKTKKTAPIIQEEEEVMEENNNRSEEYITFKLSHFYSVLVLLAFGVGVLVGYVAWGRNTSAVAATFPSAAGGQQGVVVVTATPPPTPAPVVYDVSTDGAQAIGPVDAPITIVEFSDYQCPYCYRWEKEVHDALLAAYPDKIRFVYRNFPLSFHQNAFASAEAALCAGDQDSYWKFHDLLFNSQDLLNNQAGTVLEQSQYNQFASDLGLDVATFENCMTTHKYQKFIEDDMAYAATLPNDSDGSTAVGGTPTFFINGHRLGGAYPIEYFKQIIDAELANN